MAVPDSVCWALCDKPSRTRLVTHVRLPVLPWRPRLPAPMPASWVAFVLLGVLTAWFLTFAAIVWLGQPLWLAAVAGVIPAWALGRCVVPFADVYLQREALSVLRHLHEESHDLRGDSPGD